MTTTPSKAAHASISACRSRRSIWRPRSGGHGLEATVNTAAVARCARRKPALSKLLADPRLGRSGLGILRRAVVTARKRRHDLLLLRRLVSTA
jgi:hypothetical protein